MAQRGITVSVINSFKLLGKTIRIVNDPKLKALKSLGQLRFDDGIISLRPEAFRKKIPQKHEHAFYHELVHAILLSMGEWELAKDEQFVDVFSGMIQQFIRTKE